MNEDRRKEEQKNTTNILYMYTCNSDW